MSAGSGVRHSEFNPNPSEATHFLQIWIHPSHEGMRPSYDQKTFESLGSGDLVLVGSQNGENGSVVINQDVKLYACKSKNAGERKLAVPAGRKLWIQVISGDVEAEGQDLSAGDGCAIEAITDLNLRWSSGSEFLLFDLP